MCSSGQVCRSCPGWPGDAKSYADRLFEFPNIGPLSDSDARAALTILAQSEEVRFTDGALDRIMSLARGYPYFLQEWGYHVWNAAAANPITAEQVDAVSPRVLDHLDNCRSRTDRAPTTTDEWSWDEHVGGCLRLYERD